MIRRRLFGLYLVLAGSVPGLVHVLDKNRRVMVKSGWLLKSGDFHDR